MQVFEFWKKFVDILLIYCSLYYLYLLYFLYIIPSDSLQDAWLHCTTTLPGDFIVSLDLKRYQKSPSARYIDFARARSKDKIKYQITYPRTPPGSAQFLRFPGVIRNACPPASCTQLENISNVIHENCAIWYFLTSTAAVIHQLTRSRYTA